MTKSDEKVKGLDEKIDRILKLMETKSVFEDMSNLDGENSEDKAN